MTNNEHKTEDQAIQYRIFGVLVTLNQMPKVTVTSEKTGKDILVININHQQEYVPDYRLVWCNQKKHYRVYIYVASRSYSKQNAGYCICTIPNGLTAANFVSHYSFLHKNRSNNKESV